MFVCFTACFGNSPATKFYRLSIDEFSELGMVSKTLGIMPVTIPAYLKQAQIVTQSSSTEYKLSDFNQWLEPLNEVIANTLSEAFSKSFKSVSVFPWLKMQPDLVLTLNITKFHCIDRNVKLYSEQDEPINNELNHCQLSASWSVREKDKVLCEKQIEIDDELVDFDYGSVTLSMSALLSRFAKDVLGSFKECYKN